MSNRLPPVVGHWYSHRDKGALFQVVAIDHAAGTVEMQEFEGDLDEVDMEDWRMLAVERAAQPEDWSGPVDDIDPDALGYTDLNDGRLDVNPLEEATTTWEEIVEDDDTDEFPVRVTAETSKRRDH